RPLVLRDLVALGEVRIEVVLAREDRLGLHVAAERQRRHDGVVDGLAIEDGQRARLSKTDRAHFRVGCGAERRAAAAEDLGRRAELGVNLEADDGFVGHTSGPAALTAGATSPSKVLKLSANICASFFACSSYFAASGQVLRASSTPSGTPGTAVGTSRLKIEWFL